MSYTYIDDYLDDAAPVANTDEPSGVFYRDVGKRLADIALVLLAVPIFLPVIVVAWFMMFVSGGSGFFRQPRIGRGGQIFTCWKIRTMGHHAEADLAQRIQNDPALAAEWQSTQKLSDDPRITRLGRFLRRTSIDELPQFWNVLRGDMSLIGPRPFTPDQKNLYDANQNSQAYYRLRPGISGLWQVRSRNRGNFQDRIAYDADYESNISVLHDIGIALLTVREILRSTGK